MPTTGDVTHAIAAVGSRSVDKAREFREKYCPKGAIGQQEGQVEWGVDAVGSYDEVVAHPVSTGRGGGALGGGGKEGERDGEMGEDGQGREPGGVGGGEILCRD